LAAILTKEKEKEKEGKRKRMRTGMRVDHGA
jgi:hypothetical protein